MENKKKVFLKYKMVNNETPSYFKDLLHNLVDVVSNYNFRNNINYDTPFYRLCSYETS